MATKKHERSTVDTVQSRSYFSKLAENSDQECADELMRIFSKADFAKLSVVGQFNLGFIVARLADHLFIVDQHASDEKYNYERLQETSALQYQQLLAPMRLQLSALEEMTILDNLELFRKNGFDFQVDEDQPPCSRLSLTRFPFHKNTTFGMEDVYELIALVQERPGEDFRCSRVLAMYAMRACRMSTMIGTPLNKREMQRILANLGQLKMPWACPHGRPTFRHLFDLRRIRSNV